MEARDEMREVAVGKQEEGWVGRGRVREDGKLRGGPSQVSSASKMM